jgi:hypothetical protein
MPTLPIHLIIWSGSGSVLIADNIARYGQGERAMTSAFLKVDRSRHDTEARVVLKFLLGISTVLDPQMVFHGRVVGGP